MENTTDFYLSKPSGLLQKTKLATLLTQHPWLLVNERKKHKRLYVFREVGELLIFKNQSFEKISWRLGPAPDTILLQKNNFDCTSYRVTLCRADLMLWREEDSAEELILAKTDYRILNKIGIQVEPVDMVGIRQQVQQHLIISTNTNFKKLTSMRKSSYDLYVARKMKITHLTLGKKILTYLGFGLAAVTFIMFVLMELVEQPQALLISMPYSLAGMATCFLGIPPLNNKLRDLKKKKRLKVRSTLAPAGY